MDLIRTFAILALGCILSAGLVASARTSETVDEPDPLPSWKEGSAKQSIRAFVKRVTTEGSKDFVPIPERIAVFDNDGTLWPEAPLVGQLAFMIDEVKRRAPSEPKLAADPAVQAILQGDISKLKTEGKTGLMRLAAVTHAGMTTDEYRATVSAWLKKSKHPINGKPYDRVVYQPMLEVLKYLRANGFKTFIVSGGGADFMRVWVERVYGIPPEQVVGTTAQTKFENRNGKPVLVKTTENLFVDDKAGKPVGIHQFIGRRPIACFGNSDGDEAMLEYTTIGNPHPSFGLLVHHTDGDREYKYDAKPKTSGKLVTALQQASRRGWTVVSMKDDWITIFPAEKK
jgi:phosphoserine phosphatase